MGAISGKLARVRYTATVPSSVDDQAATLAADGLSVVINATARRRWDPTSTGYNVKKTGSPLTAGTWTPLYGKGTIQFTTVHTAGTYTIDCAWLATSYLGECRSWTLETQTDMLDATAFSTSASNAAWRTFLPGLTDATVTLGRFMNSSATGPVMIDRALLGSAFYLELIQNATDQAGYVCYGRIAGLQSQESAGDLVAETVTFKPTGPIWYTT